MNSKQTAKQTVGIVGAGIVGIACALHLLRRGRNVVVIDKVGAGAGASSGNAGILACSAMVPVTTPGIMRKVPRMLLDANGPLFLRWSYLPRLLPWLLPYLSNARRRRVGYIAHALAPLVCDSVSEHQALAAGSAAARRIRPSSYLFVYDDRAAFEAERFIWGLRAAAGFCWETLEGGAVREYEPAIAPSSRYAVRLDNHATIASPGDYVKELAGEVVRLGGRLTRAEVADLRAHDDGVSIITRGGPADGIEVSAVVVASGAWSGPLGRKFGANVPLESERGYHLHCRHAGGAPRVPIMCAQRKIVVTPMDSDLRVAGTIEFGGLNAGASRAPLRMLRRTARELLPDLHFESQQEWLGHRPATPDSLPLLGPSPLSPRVFFACGHQHIGLTAGAKSGRIIASMVCGCNPGVDVSPYRVDRGSVAPGESGRVAPDESTFGAPTA